MAKPGKLFIVSAPSGAGKTSLVTHMVKLLTDIDIARAITCTTKRPRNGEQDGKDYHFISKEDFEKKIDEDFFVEYSTDYGYYYGTPRYYIDDIAMGRSWILVIDRVGAKQILHAISDAVLIWIYTKDMQTLKQRLTARKGETSHEIDKRLQLAADEILCEQKDAVYKYHILNDIFEIAVAELSAIMRWELSVENQVEVTKKIKMRVLLRFLG